MKLIVKLPLLIGLVVLISSASIIIAVQIIVSARIEQSSINELYSESRANAELISTKLNSDLLQLWEIANRARTRTMDWEIIRPNLMPDIARIGVLELGIVFPDGTYRTVSDNVTVNLGDRGYVQEAFRGRNVISDVIISRVINAPVVMLAVPIMESDAPGAPVVGLLMARQTANRAFGTLVSNIRPSHPSGYAFMTNREGILMAHPDQRLVDTMFNPITAAQTDSAWQSVANMVGRAIRERSGVYSYTLRGEQRITAFTEIPGHNDWKLFVAIERNDFESEIARIRWIILNIGIICFLSSIVISTILGIRIVKPITRVADTLKDIAQGEGDLTRNIEVKSNDEIGSLGHYFNLTIEKIKNLIIIIKKEADMLSGIGNELAVNMNQTVTAINEINANIQSIKDRVMNQSASVTETNAVMEQISGNINKLNTHILRQAGSVAQSSSAVEEMLANIQSVTQTLVKNSENVDELSGASDVGRAGLQEVAADIQEIARESEGLLEINSVMQTIASQTNLLSMNAAIEAAHAGEAGKGFAVVADEIRKLAENSSKQSKIISAVLKKIKGSIDKITQSTGNVLNKFESIDSGVKIVAQQEENIRHAMEEQGHGSKQILDAIGSMNEVTRHVEDGAKEMLEGSKEVVREGKNLEMATQEITYGMNEMATGANHINIAVQSVNELSIKNREGIAVLMKEVSRFKVE